MGQMRFGFCLRHGRSIIVCSAERLVVILARLAGVFGCGRPVSRPLIGVAVPFVHLVRVIVGVGKPVGCVRDGFGSRRKGSAWGFVCASVVVQQFVFGRGQSLAYRPRGDQINGEYCRLGLNGRQRGSDAGERKDGENADAVQQAFLGQRCRRFVVFRCRLHGFVEVILTDSVGIVNPIFAVQCTHKKVFLCLISNVYFRNSGRLSHTRQSKKRVFPPVRRSKNGKENSTLPMHFIFKL